MCIDNIIATIRNAERANEHSNERANEKIIA